MGSGCELTVQDDGAGFEPDEQPVDKAGHWGLVGMRERAHVLGGRFAVEQGSRGGTMIEAVIPVNAGKADVGGRSS